MNPSSHVAGSAHTATNWRGWAGPAMVFTECRVPLQRILQRYDALAMFLSRSTFRFKAITRPSTPSRWSIEWNSEWWTAS